MVAILIVSHSRSYSIYHLAHAKVLFENNLLLNVRYALKAFDHGLVLAHLDPVKGVEAHSSQFFFKEYFKVRQLEFVRIKPIVHLLIYFGDTCKKFVGHVFKCQDLVAFHQKIIQISLFT